MIVGIILTIVFIGLFIFWIKYSSPDEKGLAIGVIVFFLAIAALWFLCIALPTVFVDMAFSIF
jgi:hypothetical protein